MSSHALCSCKHDLTPLIVKDQFIRGLYNETLQTDILAKASQLAPLEDTIKHAEPFETVYRTRLPFKNQQKSKQQEHQNIVASSTPNTATNQTPVNHVLAVAAFHTEPPVPTTDQACPAWGNNAFIVKKQTITQVFAATKEIATSPTLNQLGSS